MAIPTIQRSLHLSVAGLEWVVSSYLLVFAGLLLAGGRLADHYGLCWMFLIGLAIFTPASLAAGLAGSGAVLIASRAVQGLGAALLVPTTLAIILATFDNPRERTAALGVWNAVGAMALASGPLIGGFISQHLHWGWIFFLNVPVGVVTFVSPWRPSGSPAATVPARPRAAWTCLAWPSPQLMLFSLTYALIEGHDRGWTSPLIAGAFALAVASLGLFLFIESRASHPMVALSMFRARVFSGGTVTMMLWAFGVFGIYFFTAIYLQTSSASRRPRPGSRSSRWPWPSRCSPAWPGRSRPGRVRTARWRAACCSWRPACR